MRICLGEYDLRFLLARGVGICGCQKLADLYYVQIAVAPIGINLELKEENNKKMRVQVQLPYNQDLQSRRWDEDVGQSARWVEGLPGR